ncbi:MAG: hypothetical protein GF331_04165 [Chitinivibrionales bacterium]|nr:hypothetical protein [Chitinivibrionales bacterium]
MNTRVCTWLVWLALVPALTAAADMDTVEFASAVVGQDMRYLVVKPTDYEDRVASGHRYPVVYLLHCAGCTDLYWCSDYYGDIDGAIDSFDMIIVAPYDGGTGGDYRWWLDSPKRSQLQLATYVVDELRSRIDSAYATYSGPMNTALAGHSMGGFGSLHLLIEYPDVFGIAVPIKAGVDLRYPLNPSWGGAFNLTNLLGTEPADSVYWQRVNVLRNAHKLQGRDIALRMYNGLQDRWFAEENAYLDTLLDSLGIDHEHFGLDEDHFDVAPSVMREVLGFIDTSFARQAIAVAPRRGAVQPELRNGPAAGRPERNADRLYDLKGIRLRGDGRGTAAGVYVSRSPWGTVTVMSPWRFGCP